ncbi:MAG: arsenic resistance N-acetyltransferase ArsN2 [Steroidobacteraceae bacterium]
MKPLIRSATAADHQAIRALLEQEGLPVSDLDSSRARFLVACAGAQHLGAVALEAHGEAGLLRSLVVDVPWRGRGLARTLVKALERQARAADIRELWLLTETAAGLFARLDYRSCERSEAPAAVRSSGEFRTLCPASALCMRKALD